MVIFSQILIGYVGTHTFIGFPNIISINIININYAESKWKIECPAGFSICFFFNSVLSWYLNNKNVLSRSGIKPGAQITGKGKVSDAKCAVCFRCKNSGGRQTGKGSKQGDNELCGL